ncbi:hypothetical protein ECANGB1_1090 [Enterospora canceri]|uniref:Uncharacterized protein n=1 Tax=Enterospora canceri TaxID=1081671 RepID=A0A1Y1S6Z6_9MICR|nr:hypothetical protein ECANGB1_1090 [Enterospora canceri]
MNNLINKVRSGDSKQRTSLSNSLDDLSLPIQDIPSNISEDMSSGPLIHFSSPNTRDVFTPEIINNKTIKKIAATVNKSFTKYNSTFIYTIINIQYNNMFYNDEVSVYSNHLIEFEQIVLDNCTVLDASHIILLVTEDNVIKSNKVSNQ